MIPQKFPRLLNTFQVKLYAEYQPSRLIDFLRASNHYSLEKVISLQSCR